MKLLLSIMFYCFIAFGAYSQSNEDHIRSILLNQLKATHTDQDWFVPARLAIEGLTVEQSKRDKSFI